MPRKSNATKALTGTLRGDRLKGVAAEQLDTAPPPPDSLSLRAVIEWQRVAPLVVSLGLLTASDLRALELLAETLATEAQLRETLDREGLTIATGTGGSKAHPALRALSDARAQASRLLDAFGLSPRGRQAIDAPPPLPPDNPYAAFVKSARSSR
ncbi:MULTISPECIES: phage terminase small subunit P27 family [Burkholderia cepacia complex]|uniref:Phage terminase, small subunit, putative, P27 n=1 Tax=Burkholderia orbicola (strain AU 1054) TaxID=331271 RepID=A0A0H2XM49_BURO1|nr:MULTISPECIES: phage terminase small subunit P27 family [Burkholderia cepacia complex]ABK08072.1 phage terminase, small subunit, putative, P27 family [Burkholderia cenocepacia HI2424]MBJ9876819.1 phage terminase small subunit P27 family [Burkholderia cenocepacia]MCA8417412.1 phage terminase small subunit P27 family [Burkholderia cenocepacia]MDN7954438.1 phage terminase small subunit P27 family [Burkholderia orbicola]PNO76314.1 phage terminase small subunit P27 family [Burkholderia cenocepaci